MIMEEHTTGLHLELLSSLSKRQTLGGHVYAGLVFCTHLYLTTKPPQYLH